MAIHPRILLKVARGYRFFPLEDIVAVEANDRYAELLLSWDDRCAVFHGLSELEQRLQCGRPLGSRLFLRVHRRFIAAIHHAHELSPDRTLKLSNGLTLPVSRERYKQLVGTCGSIH